MSATERPLSAQADRGTRRLPCDGVGRYTVDRAPCLTYAQAYAAILDATGAQKNAEGGWTFRPASIRRLRRLNESHMPFVKRAAARLDEETQRSNDQ